MPWVCGSCAASVPEDSVQACPACGDPKTSWTVHDSTRTFVVARAELTALRATEREPVASPDGWAAARWTPAAAAVAVDARHVDRLVAAGRLPAPRDVLLARAPARPGAPARDLVVTVEFEGRPARDVALPPEAGDGAHTWRLLLVRGPGAQALVTPGAVVLDVGEDGAPGGQAPALTLEWSGRRRRLPIERAPAVEHVEVDDSRFRTDSAVPMPADPQGGDRPGASAWATCLRHLEEHDGARLLVAGHTDTTGGDAWNLELSARRADMAHALLVGDRARWVEGARARHKVACVQQLLAWAAATLGWPCDPGPVDGVWGPRSRDGLLGLQRAWNAEVAPTRGGQPIAEDGVLGPQSWGALFDAQELALRRELDEDEAGLAALRAALRPLDPARPHVGCGEHHPLEAVGRDEYRSQTNRRVELVVVGPDEPLELPCHQGACEPARCALYDPARTRRAAIPPMPSARRWTARWDRARLRTGEAVGLVVDAPGLPDGARLALEVEQEDGAPLARLEAAAADGRVEAEWVVEPRRGPEPEAPALRFVARGAGRRVASGLAPHEPALGAWELPRVAPVDGEADPDPAAPPSYSEDTGRHGYWSAGEVRPVDGEAEPDPSAPPSYSEDTGRRGFWSAGEVRPVDGEAWPGAAQPSISEP